MPPPLLDVHEGVGVLVEVDADVVELFKEEDTEEVVGEEGGEEADVAALSEDPLPLVDVPVHGVEVGHHHPALQHRDQENRQRQQQQRRLRAVKQLGMEDDEVEVVADHDQLLQHDDTEGVGEHDATVAEGGRGAGEDAGEKEDEGHDELGYPDVPEEEDVPGLVPVGGEEAVQGGAEDEELGGEVGLQPAATRLLAARLSSCLIGRTADFCGGRHPYCGPRLASHWPLTGLKMVLDRPQTGLKLASSWPLTKCRG